MGLIKTLKKYWKKKGFKQFSLRFALLFAIFFVLPILIFPFLETMRYHGKVLWNGKMIYADPLPFFLIDVGAAFIFWGITFVLFSREKLLKLKPSKNDLKDNIIFGVLSVCFLASYLILRYFTAHNSEITFQHRWTFVFFLLLSLLIFFLNLVLAIFGRKFCLNFLKDFKKELFLSVILIAAYFFITKQLRVSWLFLGNIVAKSVAFLLSLSFNDVVLVAKGHSFTLGASKFVAEIGSTCSGIESIGLFLGLFIVILSLDWKTINKTRMAAILIPGLIGTVAVNIIRIYLLYLSGILISPAFAIGMFHSNAGWVLFIVYFMVFWGLAYGWVKHAKPTQ